MSYERLKDIIDYSDYQLSVDKYYYDEKDDSFGWGHEHISPLKMEKANLEWDEVEKGSEELSQKIIRRLDTQIINLFKTHLSRG